MKRLEGKVAIITGAAAGMGKVTVEKFVEEGAKITAVDLAKEDLDHFVKKLNNQYNDRVAIAIKQDVSKEEDWARTVQKTVDTFGSLNILVNNAAIAGDDAHFREASTDKWDKVMNVNGKGVMLGIKAVETVMADNGGGSIINISSLDSLTGALSSGVTYVSSKGAVQSMTKAAAIDLGGANIRVNSIHPGAIETDLIKSVLSDEELEALLETIPLSKMGDPIDVANTSLFLASDEGNYISGTEIIVDGGLRTGN